MHPTLFELRFFNRQFVLSIQNLIKACKNNFSSVNEKIIQSIELRKMINKVQEGYDGMVGDRMT
jgi:hypothetical protein